MDERPEHQGVVPRPLRILEVGANELFVLAVPQQTEFRYTGLKPKGRIAFTLGPVKFVRALKKLRRGEYDLLVMHAPQYSPWHPRSFLSVFRSWHIRAALGLFATFAWRFVHLFHSVPMVAIDLGDSCLIGRHNFFLLKAGRAFFKRELPSDHWLVFCKSGYPTFPGLRWRSKKDYIRMVERMRPLSYGIPSRDSEKYLAEKAGRIPAKSADLFYVGSTVANNSVRGAGLAELESLQREGFVVDLPTERLSRNEFYARMSKAWLAWSPAGLGWDCSRHYEAAFVSAVPVINYPNILRDVPLRDGEHCVLYAPEPGGLAQAVRTALADKARLREMGRAAAAHIARHHTLFARAERVAVAALGRRLDGSVADPQQNF